MKNLVLRNVVAPLSRRLGTAVASFVAGVIVVDPTMAERIELVLGAVAMLTFDLVASYLSRKTQEVD